eukprot:TRINITY_DN17750_c0_g1_i1.p1 TRINITY_DN17750_c0_g1~~TRINITY_DN17750_c0_g1_i1.p1  ORF type:complete len:315 (-),score=40.89 TRINITY_DN17750_c0_g1_i1:275-1219(-)
MAKPLKLLRLEPERLSLFPSETEESVVRPLKLTNASDGSVAWKVRTNATDAFLVKPRSGVLRHGETVEAHIRVLGAAADLTTVPRFEVRATSVDANCVSVEREDWNKWRASIQEAGYIVGLLQKPVVSDLERSSRRTEQCESGMGDDKSDVSELRRRAGVACRDDDDGEGAHDGVFGDTSRDDRGRSSRAGRSSPLVSNGGRHLHGQETSCFEFSYGEEQPFSRSRYSDDGPHGESTWKSSSGANSSVGGRSIRSSGNVERQPPGQTGQPPGQMGPTAKIILGMMIVLLVYNLYLKPLLRTMLSDEKPLLNSSS